MIKQLKTILYELHMFLILWSTQSFSSLGSAMTNFALVIWCYQKTGSALTTSMLSICSYAPYVLFSILAGALSDKWNKKAAMLVSDSFAALCTILVLVLLKTDTLEIWHLYVLNSLNGLMNTIQQPAADVAVSLLTPKKHYQKVSGMRSFSNSLVTILTPVLATALLSFTDIETVIFFDLSTFGIAALSLLFFIRIPSVFKNREEESVKLLSSVRQGLDYLKENRGILDLILFLAAINLTASIYNAALPAMLLSREGGGELVLGIVNTATGLATLFGSIAVSLMPAPKSRVRIICNTLLFSMSTENFLLAFGKTPAIWCLGAILGWISIPVMSANMDVLLRTRIPVTMQGRVYAARNTLQFFTIPLGYLLGGLLVDRVFEPFMAMQEPADIWTFMFGSGKGSGAAMLFLFIGILGIVTCLVFRKDRHLWELETSIRIDS